jgi:hypothetical protein
MNINNRVGHAIQLNSGDDLIIKIAGMFNLIYLFGLRNKEIWL